MGIRVRALLLACAIQPALAADLSSWVAGGPPAVEGLRVSPSGERVLAIATEGDKRAASVIELAGGPLTVVLHTHTDEQFLDECGWASDDRIVCSVFFFPKKQKGMPYSRRYRVRLVAVGRDGGNRKTLLNDLPREPPLHFGTIRPPMFHHYVDAEHFVVHHLPDDPRHVLLSAARDAEPYTSVYRVDVHEGTARRAMGHQQGIIFWHADRTGAVRLGTGWYELGPGTGRNEPYVGPTAVSVSTNRATSRIDVSKLAMPTGERDMAGPRILGFDRQGSRVYYEAAVDGAERTGVWEANAANLEPHRQLVADPSRDVRATAVQGASCGVVGFMHPLPGRPFTWLDAAIGADVTAAARKLRQEPVAVPSMSADCQRLVLATTDGANQRFHLLDRANDALRTLGTQHPGRIASALDRRLTAYGTRDGETLPMTVTLPTNAKGKLPVVVVLDADLPPDSVERRDAWPDHFASRGYLVARPVVRGQRGYGWSNHLAGRRLRGVRLQEDVEDALAWLDEQGIGDARAACFLGRAAGGHLALAAALGVQTTAEAEGARCVAAYAPKDIRRARRNPFGPFGQCPFFACDDWMRWAASNRDLARHYERRYRPTSQEQQGEPTTSPVVDASHPGIPVLIWTNEGTVHERGSGRYRDDVRKLSFVDLLAPIGSDDEVAFLEAAETLFARELKLGVGTE